MPISNLAKVFGPTLIGYSSENPDYATILGETIIQQNVSYSLCCFSYPSALSIVFCEKQKNFSCILHSIYLNYLLFSGHATFP